MKKIAVYCLLILSCALGFALPADGYYFAADPLAYSGAGTKGAQAGASGQMLVRIKGGKIVKAEWNFVTTEASQKDWRSGGTSAQFVRVADALEKDLITTQNTGVHRVAGVNAAQAGAYFKLLDRALGSKPAAKGPYSKDGWYYASTPSTPPPGYKKPFGLEDTALITVLNGSVVSCIWNGIVNYKGYSPSKLVISAADKRGYPMPSKAGKWHEQAARAEAALLAKQDPDKIDAVSGCTISLTDFKTAVKAALSRAK
jgi:major membrane immunogen (membrane-anchored lipoprotein)